MAYDVCGEMITCSCPENDQHQSVERWEITDFAFAPFASAQEGPNPVVIPELNSKILEVLAHRGLDLLLLNEQDSTIKPNVQV